jgi:fucose permease
MIAAMLGAIMPTFSLTVKQNSNVALAQAIGLMVASLSAGPIIDRHGKKAALLPALALIAITLYTLPHAAGYKQIALCFLALGFGGGMIVNAANALASDINKQRRGSTLNFLNLFFGLGLMAAPFLLANFLDDNAVKLCYLEAVLATVVLFVQIATPMPPPTASQGFNPAEAIQVLRRPELWLFALFLFLYVACEVGVSNWLATYLITRGIPKTTALNILSLGFALGLLIGRVAVSGILMKVRPATVTLACSVLMTIATYLMLQTSDPNLAAIAVFCAGLAMAPVFPTTLAMIGDAFPVLTATAMGVAITFGWIGLAASSPIIGAIAGSNSENLGTALHLFPIASAAMILVSLAVRPMLRRPTTPRIP